MSDHKNNILVGNTSTNCNTFSQRTISVIKINTADSANNYALLCRKSNALEYFIVGSDRLINDKLFENVK
jgi:hypothetical protein